MRLTAPSPRIFSARMKEEMDVGVDEAGEKRRVAEIDGFGANGMRDRLADGRDAVAFDENFAGSDDFSEFDVEQARGVEDDRVRGLRLGAPGCDEKKRDERECGEAAEADHFGAMIALRAR